VSASRARLRLTSLAGLAAVALLAAGCGSTKVQISAQSNDPARPLSLGTSVGTTAGTWAVTLVGGSAAQYNNFWQLVVRPAASTQWRLVTPPGVASNGGLVIAPMRGSSLVAAFRPSQDLVFTPLASTSNAGAGWSAGVIDAGLSDEPDALAGDQASGRLVALFANGSVDLGDSGGHDWTAIASQRRLAGDEATRRCGLTRLTGVAFLPNGIPLAAGDCGQPGVVGLFSYAAGRWQLTQAALPGAFARDLVSVLAVAGLAGRTVALLQAGSSLLVAQTNGSAWSVADPAALAGDSVSAMATSATGSIGLVLSNGQGLVLPSPAGQWQPLTRLPRGTQTLAFGPGSQVEALVPARTAVSFYSYHPATSAWVLTQALKVPVQFGSSS
jgi:hypothetical protein